MEQMVDREAKERAVESVLKSRTFARSDQLQGFLRYICELELAGRGDEISEYSIATAALRRPSDYAPGDDSSVRSRAHALRRKLKEYYEAEAPEAELRIGLPKGSYRPIFERGEANVAVALQATPINAPVLHEAVSLKPAFPWRAFLLGVAVAGLAAALVGFVATRVKMERIDPLIREAWGPAMAPAADALIVIGCPPVARVVSSYPGLTPKANFAVPAPPDLSEWFGAQHVDARGGQTFVFRSRGYNVFSDTLAAMRVSTLMNTAGVSFQAVPEPTVQPMGIHERALVLIGSPAVATFIARLLKLTPFSVRFDPGQNDEVISDGAPGTAKSAFIAKRDTATNRFSTVYGLITVLPSQPGRERPERTLIFSGISGSPGAQAAVQFFSSVEALRDLKERFRKQGYSQFPPAYQVVVRCGVDAEAAMNSVYETHRIMTTPPVIE